MRAVYRPQFWIDLEEGVAYLAAQASPAVASGWHAAVWRTCQSIEAQPDLGRLRHDLRWEGLRTLRVDRFGRYLVFYRWHEEVLEIIRVKHGMMNLPGLFSAEAEPLPD